MERGIRRRRKQQNYGSSPANYITSVEKPRFGFIAPRIKSTLKYTNVVATTILTTAGYSASYKINDLYEVLASTHQPYGFDQLATIYSRYRVVKFAFKISFSPSSDRLMVGVLPSTQAPTAVTNAATYMLAAESPYAHSQALSFNGGPAVNFTEAYSINELTGTTRSQLEADDTYAANVTAEPSQKVYLTAFIYNPSTQSVTTSYTVTIWMESILDEPYLQNQS